jgi:DnaK suppressor protein
MGDAAMGDSAMDDERRALLAAEHERAAARLAHLRRDRDEIIETVQLDAPDDEHDPDGSTLAWEREQLAALIEAEEARLAAVDAALQRLDDGGYGVCESCHDPILAARLEVRPFATHCVDCAV